MVRQHAGVKAASNGNNTGGGGGGLGENCEKIVPHNFRGKGKSYFQPLHVKRRVTPAGVFYFFCKMNAKQHGLLGKLALCDVTQGS